MPRNAARGYRLHPDNDLRADAPARPPVELALDAFPAPRTRTLVVRRADKEVFDALQAWWHFRTGNRLTQWELFSLLLADALENESGRFAPARALARRQAS